MQQLGRWKFLNQICGNNVGASVFGAPRDANVISDGGWQFDVCSNVYGAWRTFGFHSRFVCGNRILKERTNSNNLHIKVNIWVELSRISIFRTFSRCCQKYQHFWHFFRSKFIANTLVFGITICFRSVLFAPVNLLHNTFWSKFTPFFLEIVWWSLL